MVWVRSAALAVRNEARYPDAYRAVRYEALVSRPEQTMRNVCTFLGEEFEPSMLRMESESRYDDAGRASKTGIPLTTAHIGRYRDVLDRRVLRSSVLVARPRDAQVRLRERHDSGDAGRRTDERLAHHRRLGFVPLVCEARSRTALLPQPRPSAV